MPDITPQRLQQLYDIEHRRSEQANEASAELIAEANLSGFQRLTTDQEKQFRQLTTAARHHTSRMSILEELLREAMAPAQKLVVELDGNPIRAPR